MFVVFEVGVTPLGVDRRSELLVVLSVTVRAIFLTLSFSELFGCDFVEDCEMAGRSRFWRKVVRCPRRGMRREWDCGKFRGLLIVKFAVGDD